MKNFIKTIAEIDVKKCEPKMDKDLNGNVTQRQAMNPDGIKLWDLVVKESVWNEEFQDFETNYNKYKSEAQLTLGSHIVEIKHSAVGESVGSFTRVNHYFTVLKVLDEKATMQHFFAKNESLNQMKKKQKVTPAQAVQ